MLTGGDGERSSSRRVIARKDREDGEDKESKSSREKT